MTKAYKFVLVSAIILSIIALCIHLFGGLNFAVLNPMGEIGKKEKQLFIFTCLLSLVIVVPVFLMLFLIVHRYKEGNTKAKYSPDWDHNRFLEGLWWGIPCVIILILSVVTWTSSHQLDPSKAIESKAKPINIQVVALQWKWLFIYPDEKIASVNSFDFPVNTPVHFTLTADAPMNSFWIPNLGGQIYAMPGMSTQLNLMADKIGDYRGSSANISGTGFAGMDFVAKASSLKNYTEWKKTLQDTKIIMDQDVYNDLAKPSSDVKPVFYKLDDAYLYDKIVMKYMTPSDDIVSRE